MHHNKGSSFNDWIDYDYSEKDSLTDFHKGDRVQVKRKALRPLHRRKIIGTIIKIFPQDVVVHGDGCPSSHTKKCLNGINYIKASTHVQMWKEFYANETWCICGAEYLFHPEDLIKIIGK